MENWVVRKFLTHVNSEGMSERGEETRREKSGEDGRSEKGRRGREMVGGREGRGKKREEKKGNRLCISHGSLRKLNCAY